VADRQWLNPTSKFPSGKLSDMEEPSMITDSFDPRTLANMEVALERACKILGVGGEGHQARRHIAGKIVECAESGDGTLGGLTKAGRVAASELCVTRGYKLTSPRIALDKPVVVQVSRERSRLVLPLLNCSAVLEGGLTK
jgi:hypothetical protein